MCLIIDKNVVPDFSGTLGRVNALVVVEWVNRKRGRIAFGGKNMKELFDSSIVRWLKELWRNGSAFRYNDQEIDSEERQISQLCKSDDPHIIALARVSHARVLYSRDRDLHSDFTDKRLINKPRGSVYQSCDHRHLLEKAPKCRVIR